MHVALPGVPLDAVSQTLPAFLQGKKKAFGKKRNNEARECDN